MGEPFPFVRIILVDLDPVSGSPTKPNRPGHHLFRRESVPNTGINLRHLLFFYDLDVQL
jgi:hypothetical protein